MELCAAACVSSLLLWGCVACGSAAEKQRVVRGPSDKETVSWDAVSVGGLGTGCSERQEGAAGPQQKADFSPVR